MNSDFSFIKHKDVEVLVYLPWWRKGIVHGTTTSLLSFDRSRAESSARLLQHAFQFSRLILPLQVHGAELADLRSAERLDRCLAQNGIVARAGECDGLLAPCVSEARHSSLAFGVLSADCVPVIVRSRDSWGLIHAGWRGLANGVIEKAIRAMNGVTEGVVFPCAGGERYEVGSEVIKAIGGTAVYTAAGAASGRFYLDTAGTAIKQLRISMPGIHAVSSGICSISDERFHSHRRAGQTAGRSITFVCV